MWFDLSLDKIACVAYFRLKILTFYFGTEKLELEAWADSVLLGYLLMKLLQNVHLQSFKSRLW